MTAISPSTSALQRDDPRRPAAAYRVCQTSGGCSGPLSARLFHARRGLLDQVCKNLLGPATIGADARPAPLPADVTSRAASSLDAGLAIERLEKCVVGTQEDWAGARRAIDHWFPWLSFDDDVRRNVGFSDAETRQTLRPELSAAIERCNACDLAVYEAATRRVEAFLDERAATCGGARGAGLNWPADAVPRRAWNFKRRSPPRLVVLVPVAALGRDAVAVRGFGIAAPAATSDWRCLGLSRTPPSCLRCSASS